MNNKLEIKKLQAELAAVASARINLEYRIEESLDNIRRLEDHIKIQVLKEEELNNKIKELA